MYTDFLKKARKTIADISPFLGISGPDFDTTELTILSSIHLTGDIETAFARNQCDAENQYN